MDDDHYVGHVNEEVEAQEEQPAVGQDAQVDFDTGEVGVEPEDHLYERSDVGWDYSESVGRVRPVEPEPDAMQKYLEDSGP